MIVSPDLLCLVRNRPVDPGISLAWPQLRTAKCPHTKGYFPSGAGGKQWSSVLNHQGIQTNAGVTGGFSNPDNDSHLPRQ